MSSADYRIESNRPLIHRLLPHSRMPDLFEDRSLAVAMAAKSITRSDGQEVRVVHVPSGEIVFRTSSSGNLGWSGTGNDFDA